MRNKELKIKFQKKISNASLPVNDLRNGFKSIILDTDQKKNFTLHEVILGGKVKISTIFSK